MDKDPMAIEHVAFKVTPPRAARVKHHSLQPRTLAVDVGGSHVKAIVLSADGAALSDEVLIATPHPCPPEGVPAQPENRNGKSERPSQGGNDVLLAIR
jgi:hypothetical protein